nr:hypothetical protein [Micromonospora sp. HM5-17]
MARPAIVVDPHFGAELRRHGNGAASPSDSSPGSSATPTPTCGSWRPDASDQVALMSLGAWTTPSAPAGQIAALVTEHTVDPEAAARVPGRRGSTELPSPRCARSWPSSVVSTTRSARRH